MRAAMVSLLIVMLPFPGGSSAQSTHVIPSAKRIEVRVETLANRENGPSDPCEVRQVKSANSPLAFAFWSTVDATPGSDIEDVGKKDASAFSRKSHCGVGSFPGDSPAPSGPPVLIQEVSATVGWDPGTMDPGAGRAFRVSLTLSSRQLTGSSNDGKPIYSAPVKDLRNTRLEPGEEYLVPIAIDPHGREKLNVHEIVLRIRAGWASRDGATEYGTLAIEEAAPSSEVVLDGGVTGRAGPDGRFLLSNVPVGQHQIRIRGMSGSVISRIVSVVRGRTVLVTPEAAASGSPHQPSLTAAGKNSQGFAEYRRVRDGAIMVHIPEGDFMMGNLRTEGAPLPHTVYVSAFLMDKLPLTVGRFKRFAAATGRPLPPHPYWAVRDDFPVAFVRWDEAKAYCEWTGGRLPTEAEREKAARGIDGRMWPWGSEPPSPERAVFRRIWGVEGNDAVGIRPAGASPYGLLDTGGNMWEFCEDWWSPDYYSSSPRKDPVGPKIGRARVVRGGSWDSRPTVLSVSSRNFAYTGYREGDFGFRCAADPHR